MSVARLVICYIVKDICLLRSEKIRITYQEMSSLPEGIRTSDLKKGPIVACRVHWQATLLIYNFNSLVVLLFL